jgi:hypothetical protein
MIHYHGLPITPATSARAAVSGGHAFVSHRYADQLGLVLDICQSFAVDNGAFSAWKSGNPIVDWSLYYEWVESICRFPSFDFAVIPDVIGGNENENDALLAEWPFTARHAYIGAPVWHMHESIERFERLANEWSRICIGSSGDFATVGNKRWWSRIAEAMNAVCDKNGLPITKIHGLRMLDPEVFSRLPFSSADSTNIAQNIGIDNNWKGTYMPVNKDARAQVMRDRIESHQAKTFWQEIPIQESMFLI